MKNSTNSLLTMCLIALAGAGTSYGQFTFTNSNSELHSDAGTAGSNANNRSGNSMCVIDVDNNGYDDIVKLDNNQYLRIEYQQSDGSFTYVYVGATTASNAWGMSMADVDHNGYKDLLYLGGSQAYLYKLNATGTGFLGSGIALPNGAIFCQNGNFMDVNNDGWEDIFACNDVNESRLWLNNGSGGFPAEAGNSVINFDVTPGTAAPNDESGNYGSVWSDFDNDGDVDFYIIHCRQSYGPGDIRRTNVLFENMGGGTYTSNAAAHNLASNDQDWTGSFGDIDNDGDFDLFMTKHDVISRYYFNDGNGNFTISPNTIAFGNMPMQSLMEDFDNDGFVDIIITGDNDHRLYRNNGNGTFTNATPSNWTISSTNILSFAAGDLNHDGKVDIYTSYGGTYNSPSGTRDDVYWKNTTSNSNHFLTVDLEGTVSNKDALGARVFIYGAWGVQTREVRASESYGTINTGMLHFGLGSATTVDSIRVRWPSGLTDLLLNQTADQFITIIENQCTLSGISVDYSGSTTFCSGDSLQLTAPTGVGYSYLWSNGATTQSIYANSSGNYSVQVSTSLTCSASSPVVNITVDPDETPSITANGPTTFCPGATVDLTASTSTNNTWSNSATTQTVTVSTPGNYYVNYQGLCQTFQSNMITITNLAAPAPTTTDDYLSAPGAGTLTATGSNISWYDAASGGSVVGSGSPFTTPVVSANTTYYAEGTVSYGADTLLAGSANLAASTYSGNTINGFLKFDVLANCTLLSVDVTTDAAGVRTIELRDNAGAVIQSTNVNLAVGTTTVALNFPLTPGTNYQLGTNSTQNNTALGYVSPRLVRDNTSPAFPYTTAGYVDITTGNNGTSDVNAYYYFFNWQLDIPATDVCTTPRTPATVYLTQGVEDASEYNITVYPNPTTDYVNVEFTTNEAGTAMISVFDMLGKKVYDLNIGDVNGNVIRTISTATYAQGVYTVKLTINGKEYNTRVIVK